MAQQSLTRDHHDNRGTSFFYYLVFYSVVNCTVSVNEPKMTDQVSLSEKYMMAYITFKFILTLIFWFLIGTLLHFIFEKQSDNHYGLVKYINQLRPTQYTVFILAVLFIGLLLNLFITSGDFYYKWVVIYAILPIGLWCLNKYRD
ncbi:hypothetical protein [Leuconostoc lactis]